MNDMTTGRNLMRYLDCVKDMEVSVQKLNTAYQQVSRKVKQYENAAVVDELPLKKVTRDQYTSLLARIFQSIVFAIFIAITAFVVVAIFVIFKVLFKHSMAVLNLILGGTNYFVGQFGICRIVAMIAGIAGFVFWMCDAGSSKREAKKDVREYNEQVKIENERRRNVAHRAQEQAKLYKMELAIIKEDYQKVKNVLDQYYDLNYIYPKYRKLVYICSIYEYFDSGRCNTLIGPYGAYNLLEQDIKYSKIVDRLDNISDKLDIVIENQQLLYHALNECKRSISSLEDSMNSIGMEINNGLSNIDERLANIEFNTTITAQCSEYMAIYDFFKN